MSATIHITAKFGPRAPKQKGNKKESRQGEKQQPALKPNPNETPTDYNTRLILSLCRNYLHRFVPTTVFFRDVTDPNEHYPLPPTHRSTKKIHWQTMTTIDIADFPTLTGRYIKPILYQEALEVIRKELNGHRLWATISTAGRFDEEYNYVNVIVGTFEASMKAFLVACKEVKVTDPMGQEEGEEKAFYLELFYEAMNLLWPTDSSAWTSHILYLITEPLDGMYHAGLELKATHPRLLHLTCLNRTLHLLEQLIILPTEDISSSCQNYRRATFKILLDFHQHLTIIGRPAFYKLSKLPELPESFGPLDNLLEWVDYVHRHFESLRAYLQGTDTFWGRDQLLELFQEPDTRRNLATLKVKYQSLSQARSVLLTKAPTLISLERAIEAVEQFRTKLSKWPDEFEQKLSGKFDELLSINDGYRELVAWSSGQSATLEGIEEQDLELFRNAPITALTRGQCFPRFEQLLRLYPDYPIPPEAMSIYAIIYTTKEMMNRSCGVDEMKTYYQLNYRQEMYNKGHKLKELSKASAAVTMNFN